MSRVISNTLLRRWRLPEPNGALGKVGRGSVLVVGGGVETPGAVILAGLGALRVGAGKLQLATDRRVAGDVAIAVPEARVVGVPVDPRGGWNARRCQGLGGDAATCDAVLIGPGMPAGATTTARAIARGCLRARGHAPIIVVDAGALDLFSGRKPLTSRAHPEVILTPHPGEMAALWGVTREEVLAEPEAIALEAAAALKAIVVLKGARTHVAGSDGRVFHHVGNNPGLGTSGSGDVLAGVIAGLCARGAAPMQAAVWGVVLHARAGDRLARLVGPLGFLAREILGELPRVLAAIS